MAKKNVDGKDKDDGVFIGGMILMVLILLGPLLIQIFWGKLGLLFSWLFTHIRQVEIWIFALAFDGAKTLWELLGLAIDAGGSLSLENFQIMMSKTGYYVRWLFVPTAVGLAVFAFLRSPRERFSTIHTMESLAKQESAVWPEIAPVAGLQSKLIKADPTSGEWASAMTEREFADLHNLLTSDEEGKPAAKREESRAVFAKQVGAPWTSVDALPKHTKALFAIFAMRIGGDQAGALEKLRLMARTFADSGIAGMDTSWVNASIKKHGNHELVQRVLHRHAFIYTVMATMLQIAKADGVLASPMFIWVKTVDRGLWYTLNNVGRYAFHVDCAGIMAHWLFEKTVGFASPSPMVDKAVDGLDMALKEYREDDSLTRLYQ